MGRGVRRRFILVLSLLALAAGWMVSSAPPAAAVVDDTEPPVVTAPASIIVSNDPNQAGAVVNYPPPTATDNVAVQSLVCSPASGSFFPLGTTTVTCTATDLSGNTASASFTITVVDTQPPSITAPANITVSNDPNQGGAVVNYPPPSVADNAPGVTVVCVPPSGSFFPVGTTPVTCTATDVAGNTATASFTITVVDTQPPYILVPANVTANAASPSGTVVSYPPPTASDNAPGVTASCSPPSGSVFPVGTTTVTCTATDAAGNTATAAFTVTVQNAVVQLQSLINSVQGMQIKPLFKLELLIRLHLVRFAMHFGGNTAECRGLASFNNRVSAESGRKLSVGDASTLILGATQLRNTLGC